MHTLEVCTLYQPDLLDCYGAAAKPGATDTTNQAAKAGPTGAITVGLQHVRSQITKAGGWGGGIELRIWLALSCYQNQIYLLKITVTSTINSSSTHTNQKRLPPGTNNEKSGWRSSVKNGRVGFWDIFTTPLSYRIPGEIGFRKLESVFLDLLLSRFGVRKFL